MIFSFRKCFPPTTAIGHTTGSKLQLIISRNTDYLRAAQLDNLVVVTGNVGHGGELDWNTTSSFVAVSLFKVMLIFTTTGVSI